MFIEINKIQIEDRIRKDYGDIEELAKDIKENGLINPPLVTPDYVLIAGERRTRACKFLGYEQIEVNVMTVKNALHKLKLEISENENRKDFSFSEKMKWAKQLENEYSKIAAENIKMTQFGSLASQKSVKPIRTDELVAKEIGIGSRDTYRKAEYISENGDEELIKKLDEGQLSINKAYKTLKQQKQELEKEKEELRNENLNLQQKNNNLQDKLVQEQNKPPIEKVVDNTDYEKVNKIQRELEYQKERYNFAKEKEETYKQEIEILEKNSNKYKDLKRQIELLTKEKDDISRMIKSATDLSGYVYDIESFLKNKLAPVQYSRSIIDAKNNPTVIKNIIQIVECVEKWCLDIRKCLPEEQQNIINVNVEER